jgi:hypothetical protein
MTIYRNANVCAFPSPARNNRSIQNCTLGHFPSKRKLSLRICSLIAANRIDCRQHEGQSAICKGPHPSRRAATSSRALPQRKSGALIMPRFFVFRNLFLPPVPFHQHPSAVAVHPVVCNPNGVRMWRLNPNTATPYIAVSIPVVIARLPNPSRMRAGRACLDNGGRGPDANHNLSKRGRGKQSKRKQSCHCNFLHSQQLLQE